MRIFLSSLATALVLTASTAHSKPVSPASGAAAAATPEEARAKLNKEQAEAAQRQLEENTANQKAHDDAVRANEELIRRQQAEYEAAMARWKADVEACKSGDRSKCAAQ